MLADPRAFARPPVLRNRAEELRDDAADGRRRPFGPQASSARESERCHRRDRARSGGLAKAQARSQLLRLTGIQFRAMEFSGVRVETARETALEYRPGEHVVVTVLHRERRLSVTDRGAGLRKAGSPPGWR